MLFLTYINLIAGNIPGIMPELGRLCGLILCVIWTVFFFPLKIRRSFYSLMTLFFFLAGFYLILYESFFLLGTVVLIFALQKLSRSRILNHKEELSVCLSTILLYSLFYLLYMHSAYIWCFINLMSQKYSALITFLFGNKMTLGPSACGIKITFSVLCYSISMLHYKRDKIFILSALIAPLIANILWLGIQKPLIIFVNLFDKGLNPQPFNFQILLILISALFVYPLWKKIKF